MQTTPAQNGRLVVERLGPRGADERRFDAEFWRNAGHEARFAAAWQMIAEAQLFKGADGRQPRLQRSVQALVRRAG